MLADRNGVPFLTCKFLLFAIAVIFSFSPTLSYANEIESKGAVQFERAGVETIKMHTHQILSDPEFAPRKTFWQWLAEKFSGWEKPKFNLGLGWAEFILWVIIIWCVLTLIAILIHLIWSISLLIRPSISFVRGKGGPGSKPVKIKSFEELYKMAQELAKNEKFSEAISIMIVALLRWLDSVGIVRFHESKTNGDYIREYTYSRAGRNEFKEFVLIYEYTIYGGLHGSSKTYQRMSSLMEHIRNCVSEKT